MQRETPRDDLRALSRRMFTVKKHEIVESRLMDYSSVEEVKASAVTAGGHAQNETKQPRGSR
jgi:hypothetical protein